MKNGEFTWIGGGILPLKDLLMEQEFTQRTFISFFKFQCFFFLAIFCIVARKGSNSYNGFFFGKLTLSYHILRKTSLNFSYLEYRFQVLGSGQSKLGLRVAVHYQRWWKKWVDFVKIMFHLIENIEWHCMQLELNTNSIVWIPTCYQTKARILNFFYSWISWPVAKFN